MKPILFNTDMVRAILANRKTMTRRLCSITVNGGMVVSHKHCCAVRFPEEDKGGLCAQFYDKNNFYQGRAEPPYRPGDILYVRETWAQVPDLFGEFPEYIYRADYAEESLRMDDDSGEVYSDFPACVKWRPSIHMPREAARIFLRVTDVRVEQLYEITGKQARAEGFLTRDAFIRAFLAMYPDCTVKSWVWPIEFERISREEAIP